MPMRFNTRVFALAKDPDQPTGYQDAYCMDARRGIAALADGVSSAIFSGPWATILTEAVVAEAPDDPGDAESFAAWLDQQRKTWSSRINTNGLAWFQRAKLPAGAFSTLLWICVTATDDAEARAFGGARLLGHAIGDTCLFVVRGGELVHTFPLQSSAEFQVDPIVLGSVDLKRDQLLQFATLDVFCYPDDLLILCTDALADWAMRGYESGQPPDWESYWDMPDEEWRAEIAWLRHERQMRYDDATLVLLRVVDQRVELSEPEALVEPEATVEPETAGEPEPVVEPEPTIELEALAELDAIIRAETRVEAEPVVEAEAAAETAPAAETEPAVEAEPAAPTQPPAKKRRWPLAGKKPPFGRG